MAKVRTLSRTFMKGHPREGQPTYFVEKFYNQQGVKYKSEAFLQRLLVLNTLNLGKGKLTYKDIESFWLSLKPTKEKKHHTIRNGEHFKAGDKISLRTWSRTPYNSPQIILASDIPVNSTYDFYIDLNGIYSINGKYIDEDLCKKLAKNDGLSDTDMMFWFIPNYNKPKEFQGQIICWSNEINYN